jgi:TIR domain/inactive STAND
MPDTIFISYSSKDRETAEWICGRLEADLRESTRCWIAPRDVDPEAGVPFGEAIVRAIKSSRVVLLVFSAHANDSSQVASELTIAMRYNVRIVPFCIDACEATGHMEYVLATPHQLRAHEPPLEPHYERLLQMLGSFLGVTPTTAREETGGREGVRGAGASGASASNEISPIVPYLVDRREQERTVQGLLREAWHRGITHPMACLLHGDEQECLDSFLDRMHRISLPKTLLGAGRGDQIKEIHLEWPKPGSTDIRLRGLRDDLTDRLEIAPTASDGEIRQALAQLRRDLVTIATSIKTADWQSNEEEVLASWLRTFGGYEPLPATQTVCVLVKVYHKPPAGGFLGRFRKSGGKEQVLESLERAAQQSGLAPTPAILPEFVGITQSDVEDWVREHAQKHCNVRDVEALLQAARDLFTTGEFRRAGQVPMKLAAPALLRLARMNQG